MAIVLEGICVPIPGGQEHRPVPSRPHSALPQQAGGGGRRRPRGAAFLRGDDGAGVVDAGGVARPHALAARLGAGGPGAQAPERAGDVAAGLDVLRLEGSVAGGGRLALNVPAVHRPPLPARATGLGALGPVAQDPLGGEHRADDVGRLLLFALLLAEGDVLGDEEGVLDLGWEDLAGDGQQLDGQRLGELPEALQPLQGRHGAAVLQDGPLNEDVLLHGRDGEVAVQQVLALQGPQGQVIPVVTDPAVAALLDVDVGGPGGDGDDVVVAVPVWGKATRLFSGPVERRPVQGITFSKRDHGSEAVSQYPRALRLCQMCARLEEIPKLHAKTSNAIKGIITVIILGRKFRLLSCCPHSLSSETAAAFGTKSPDVPGDFVAAEGAVGQGRGGRITG